MSRQWMSPSRNRNWQCLLLPGMPIEGWRAINACDAVRTPRHPCAAAAALLRRCRCVRGPPRPASQPYRAVRGAPSANPWPSGAGGSDIVNTRVRARGSRTCFAASAESAPAVLQPGRAPCVGPRYRKLAPPHRALIRGPGRGFSRITLRLSRAASRGRPRPARSDFGFANNVNARLGPPHGARSLAAADKWQMDVRELPTAFVQHSDKTA